MKMLLKKILKFFGFGFCVSCGKLTKQKYPFSDDDFDEDSGVFYKDFCHDNCFEEMADY